MAALRRAYVLLLCALMLLCWTISEAAREQEGMSVMRARSRRREKRKTALSKEATIGGFMRLVAMRLLFGFASWVGLGDWASGIFGGVLSPPGSDYDYGDYGGDYDY